MMQQSAPLLVAAGLTEAFGVIFQRCPVHQPQVAAGLFQAPVQGVGKGAAPASLDLRGRLTFMLERKRKK
jgi:hypothetical protein